MTVIGKPLFGRLDTPDILNVICKARAELSKSIDQYDDRTFDGLSDEAVALVLATRLSIKPIVLDLEAAKNKVEEVKVRVPMPAAFDISVTVPGLRVTKTFRFNGDAYLWDVGAGHPGATMPYGEVNFSAKTSTITIGVEVREIDGEKAPAYMNKTVEEIKGYLAHQKVAIDKYNQSLESYLLPRVQERRARRKKAKNLIDKF